MGAEQKANQQIGRAVVEQTVTALGQLEETVDRHKKITNNQGRALEALAKVITAMHGEVVSIRGELAEMNLRIAYLELPWYRRWAAGVRSAWRTFLDRVAEQTERLEAGVSCEEVFGAQAQREDAMLEQPGESIGTGHGVAPRPDHLHQFQKDGPFFYRCTVDGCEKRATLEEIAAEAEYLRDLNKAKG